ERPAPAQEFVHQLPRKTQKALERFVIPGLTAAALPVAAAAPGPGNVAQPSAGASGQHSRGASLAAPGVAADNRPAPGPGSELLPNPDAWMHALAQAEDRAGILACDDFGAAARSLAVLIGEEIAVVHGHETPLGYAGGVTLGAVPGGAELVRYFLSDDYHRLRVALSEPPNKAVVKPVT